MTSLSSKAMLVSLNVSQWQARKYDRKASAEVAQQHGTTLDVARVNKALLPYSQSLDAVHKKTGSVRTEFYSRTLPWGVEGLNILKSDGYMDFVAAMNVQMNEWRQLAAKFVQEYPALHAQAPSILNGLYRPEDYPDPDDIARRFKIDIGFMPVPDAGDWRVSLGDEEMDDLRKQIEARVVESEGAAMKAAWKRVFDTVSHAYERLKDPKAIFRDSLLENAEELCKLLPSLNITDDPDLEAMRQEIERGLCSHNPTTLRLVPSVRSDAAAKMKAIMDKMGPMYGTP